jgi:hypothetical protein
MSLTDVLLLNFIGVALLYSIFLLNGILFKGIAESSNAVQMSDPSTTIRINADVKYSGESLLHKQTHNSKQQTSNSFSSINQN